MTKDFTPCLYKSPNGEWSIYARWLIPEAATLTGKRECTMHHEIFDKEVIGATEILPVYEHKE